MTVGVGVGVGVGLAVGVRVGVAVGVGVGVAVGVGVGDGVAVAVGDGEDVVVGVGAGVSVEMLVGDRVCVLEGVGLSVLVSVVDPADSEFPSSLAVSIEAVVRVPSETTAPELATVGADVDATEAESESDTPLVSDEEESAGRDANTTPTATNR